MRAYRKGQVGQWRVSDFSDLFTHVTRGERAETIHCNLRSDRARDDLARPLRNKLFPGFLLLDDRRSHERAGRYLMTRVAEFLNGRNVRDWRAVLVSVR